MARFSEILKMPALKELLKARQLPRGGKKAQLVARLHESDRQRTPEVQPPVYTVPLTPTTTVDANLGTLERSFRVGFSDPEGTPDVNGMDIDEDGEDPEMEIGEEGGMRLVAVPVSPGTTDTPSRFGRH